jgi:ATP-dependent DNA helicase RecG
MHLVRSELVTKNTHQKQGQRASKKPQRSPKEVILAALKEQPSISIRALAVQCQMSIHGVQHHVNKLKDAGVIRHVGPTKGGRWEVLEDRRDSSKGGVGGGDE